MLKRIVSFFVTDLHWKLLSLLVAFVLWFVGMHMNNPPQNHSVHQRLHLNNIDFLANEDIILLNEAALRDSIITLGVRASRSEIAFLQSAIATDSVLFDEMVRLSIDFLAINSDFIKDSDEVKTVFLDVSPNLYPGFEHFSIRPSYVPVVLDALEQERFNVNIYQIGEEAPGFEMQPVQLANNWVNVSGGRTLLRTIEGVRVDLDVAGIHDYEERTVSIKVFDTDGLDVTEHVILNVNDTTASIRVWPIRAVDVSLHPYGTLANGFAVADIYSETESIYIVGPAHLLEEIDVIPIDVYVGGAVETEELDISLSDWLPQGVFLQRGFDDRLGVTVTVEPIETRVVNVPRDSVRILGVTAMYQILGDAAPVNISISGPRSLISNVTPAHIGLEIDLRNLTVGAHFVPLNVELPPGLTAGARPSLHVQIHSPADLDDDNDEPNDAEEPTDDNDEQDNADGDDD